MFMLDLPIKVCPKKAVSVNGDIVKPKREYGDDEKNRSAGCFISKLPKATVYLCLSLHLAEGFSVPGGIKAREGEQLLRLAADRLGALMDRLDSGAGSIGEYFRFEKKGWHLFYDLLDLLEKALLKNDPFAIDLREKARSLFKECCL